MPSDIPKSLYVYLTELYFWELIKCQPWWDTKKFIQELCWKAWRHCPIPFISLHACPISSSVHPVCMLCWNKGRRALTCRCSLGFCMKGRFVALRSQHQGAHCYHHHHATAFHHMSFELASMPNWTSKAICRKYTFLVCLIFHFLWLSGSKRTRSVNLH